MRYRLRVELVSSVLSALRATSPEGGSTAATLMRLCNISYGGLQRLLADLVKAEMAVPVQGELSSAYVITEKGVQFLEHYLEFQAFADAFGLEL